MITFNVKLAYMNQNRFKRINTIVISIVLIAGFSYFFYWILLNDQVELAEEEIVKENKSTEKSTANQSKGKNAQEIHNFRWDLSQGNKYHYSYAHSLEGENSGGFFEYEPHPLLQIFAVGDIIIHAKNKGLARFSLLNVEPNQTTYDQSNGEQLKRIEAVNQSYSIPEMKENGHFKRKKQEGNIVYFIFPLPTKNLKVGQKEKIDIKYPYYFEGKNSIHKGVNEIQYVGESSVNNMKCSKLTSRIYITESPIEISTNIWLHIEGRGSYLFDSKNGFYTKSEIELRSTLIQKNEGQNDTISKSRDLIEVSIEE